MEGDEPSCDSSTMSDISTHALTWRATGKDRRGEAGVENFYPRPHMEGDPDVVGAAAELADFYPRPHMEGDSSSALR